MNTEGGEPRYALGALRDFVKDWQHLNREDFAISELANYVGGDGTSFGQLREHQDELRHSFELTNELEAVHAEMRAQRNSLESQITILKKRLGIQSDSNN